MEPDPPAPWGTKKEFFLLVDAKKKLEKILARQILVKNVGAEKKKLASVLSPKFSWDRARAERAILGGLQTATEHGSRALEAHAAPHVHQHRRREAFALR